MSYAQCPKSLTQIKIVNGEAALPVVSYIVACRNAADYVSAAISSALAQSRGDIEIIVIDDSSTDSSKDIADAFARSDERVRVYPARGRGVSAARNLALDHARGDWVGVLDADDLLHPDRTERLLQHAENNRLDVVGDNLIVFTDGDSGTAPRLLVRHRRFSEPCLISLDDYMALALTGGAAPAFGVLKPLIAQRVLGEARYDESLDIGEDQDFYARLLTGGARFGYLPEAFYFYRKHKRSTSFRWSAAHLAAMAAAEARFRSHLPKGSTTERLSLHRSAELANEARATEIVTALKQKRVLKAASGVAGRPAVLPRLSQIGAEIVRNRLPLRPANPRARTNDGSTLARMQVTLDRAHDNLRDGERDQGGYRDMLRACFALDRAMTPGAPASVSLEHAQ